MSTLCFKDSDQFRLIFVRQFRPFNYRDLLSALRRYSTSLTQVETGLLRDLLTKKDERTPLQKLLNSYDMYIWDEKQHKEKLRVALEELITCKNEDEMELLIEEKIEGLEEEIKFGQSKQREITEKITGFVRYEH